MPPIITCIVAKRIGNRLSDNHWELRDFSANLVALICKRFGLLSIDDKSINYSKAHSIII